MVLRLPAYTASDYTTIATEAVDIAKNLGSRLLLTSSADEVLNLGAGGLHLNSQRLMALKSRPVSKRLLVSAACHSVEQLKQAERLDVDFVFLSPVKQTASHPDATLLGWPQFSAWAEQRRLPVYALGGMRHSDLNQAFQSGAQGIAGISGFWQS